jgi:hypothetical protein
VIKKRLGWIASAMLLALAPAVLVAASADAASPSITCTGWDHDTYNPGVTNIAQPVAITTDEDLNVIDAYSPTGSCVAIGSSATAEQVDGTATAEKSCLQFVSGQNVTYMYNWNDGQSSTASVSQSFVRGAVLTVITYTGTVTSGEFKGDSVVETLTAPSTAFLNCFTSSGVTVLDFATSLTITGL